MRAETMTEKFEVCEIKLSHAYTSVYNAILPSCHTQCIDLIPFVKCYDLDLLLRLRFHIHGMRYVNATKYGKAYGGASICPDANAASGWSLGLTGVNANMNAALFAIEQAIILTFLHKFGARKTEICIYPSCCVCIRMLHTAYLES